MDIDGLAAADRNMIEAWQGVVGGAPVPRVAEEPGLVLMSSGIPISLFNPTFVTSSIDDPTGVGHDRSLTPRGPEPSPCF